VKTVEANEGDDILAIAHEYDVDLEGIFFALLLQFKQACSQPSFISLLLPDIPRFSFLSRILYQCSTIQELARVQ